MLLMMFHESFDIVCLKVRTQYKSPPIWGLYPKHRARITSRVIYWQNTERHIFNRQSHFIGDARP